LRYNAIMDSNNGHIDFHCHLDDPCFAENRWQIIDQCVAAGFSKLITVANPYNEQSLEQTAEILSSHTNMDSTIGAHPHQADQYSAEIEKRIFGFFDRFKILAIGEVGLDFHYDFSSRDKQINTFKRQMAIARECSLPLVIHARNAEPQVLEILSLEKFDQPVVFHCYTGDKTTAAEILSRGYGLSFSGIITFKKAEELREIVASTPVNQLFSETDSPYLAPEPDRGKTNTPLAVIRVAAKIAEIKKITTPDLLTAINKNYQSLRR
jgi:TatD DNase family protein